MKKINTLFFVLFTFVCFSLQAQPSAGSLFYVDSAASGANNGSSWADAYTSLQTALDSAQMYDTIWVTSNTYFPSKTLSNSTDPRSKTFLLMQGASTQIYGGFAGTESNIDQRNPYIQTILSGDIGILNDSSDNAYHVMMMLNHGGVLDGFTVINGNASGTGTDSVSNYFISQDLGGGIYMDTSDISIRNCTISFNHSTTGGAGVYSYAGYPQFSQTHFRNNRVNGSNTNAGGGGGIFNVRNNASFHHVTFENNGAFDTQGGGGMRNEDSDVQLDSVEFNMNIATNGDGGGGMYNLNSVPVLNTVVFDTNYSNKEAGAMYNDGSPAIMNTVYFFRNASGSNGAGAIENDGGSDIEINYGIFEGNTSQGDGGAIQNWKSSPVLTNVSFIENHAGGDGGAMVNYNTCDPIITNVVFERNTALGNGGAMYTERNSNPVITNSLFFENKAGDKGGAIAVVAGAAACSPILTNVTIVKNHADSSGGGIYSDGQGSGKIRNSIVHGNTASRDADIDAPQSMLPTAVFNDIFGNEYYANGLTLPVPFTVEVFIDTANGDYRLSATGPAFDSGDTSFYAASATPNLSSINTDLRGAARVMGNTIDLGAFETCDTVLIPSVTIVANPPINNQIGDTIIFTAIAQNGGQHPEFEWYLNGIFIAFGSDSNFIALAGIDYGLNDTLTVILTSSEPCADSTATASFDQDIITSITTHEESLIQINLFPNPNKGNFTVTSSLKRGTAYQLQIVDIRGQELYNRSIGENTPTINLDLNGQLQTGMYFLIIKSANQVQGVTRFVVQ